MAEPAKKIVELRLPTGKPGTQGSEVLTAYCERPSPDTLLIVSLPRVDRTTQNSAWFLSLAEAGVLVDIWPVERSRLPGWISERLAQHSLQVAKRWAPERAVNDFAQHPGGEQLGRDERE